MTADTHPPDGGAPSSLVGRRVDKYVLLEEVGVGGMAVVYRALDTTLNREVAVKVLHPAIAAQPEARRRLGREAHAVAKLRHENILEIFDYSGGDSAEGYIVTELIRGRPLHELIRSHPITCPEVAALIAVPICRALSHAHGLGVIHRDIKPENVMIRDDGQLKLTDFGIAQIIDSERMTITGQLLGSPAYMAPEQIQGKTIDFRTDVFAVGVLLYQLAVGELPFKGKNPHEVLKRIADGRFVEPRLLQPRISVGLARIIHQALAREPDDRFTSMELLHRALVAELALVGLTDVPAELRALFAAPEVYQEQLRGRLIGSLMEAAERARAAGRLVQAFAPLNRVLAIDPAHQEARLWLTRLGRRQQTKRLLVAAGIAALTAIGVWRSEPLLNRWLTPSASTNSVASRSVNQRPAGASPTARPTLPTAGSPPHPGGSSSAVAGPQTTRTERQPVATDATGAEPRRPLASPPPRVLDLIVRPRNYDVVLDGKHLGLVDRVVVGAGRHRLRIENPGCCVPQERLVDEHESHLDPIRLPWKDAMVVVQTNAGVVEIDGQIAAPGQAVPVHIDSLDEREKAVLVTVRGDGRATSKLVTVRGGERTELQLDL